MKAVEMLTELRTDMGRSPTQVPTELAAAAAPVKHASEVNHVTPVSGLSRSATPRQLERALDELNAGRPQCPVGLHTLIVPKKNSTNIAPEAQPMVYLKCGHVQVRIGSKYRMQFSV